MSSHNTPPRRGPTKRATGLPATGGDKAPSYRLSRQDRRSIDALPQPASPVRRRWAAKGAPVLSSAYTELSQSLPTLRKEDIHKLAFNLPAPGSPIFSKCHPLAGASFPPSCPLFLSGCWGCLALRNRLLSTNDAAQMPLSAVWSAKAMSMFDASLTRGNKSATLRSATSSQKMADSSRSKGWRH